jgi:hypothetical protein
MLSGQHVGHDTTEFPANGTEYNNDFSTGALDLDLLSKIDLGHSLDNRNALPSSVLLCGNGVRTGSPL